MVVLVAEIEDTTALEVVNAPMGVVTEPLALLEVDLAVVVLGVNVVVDVIVFVAVGAKKAGHPPVEQQQKRNTPSTDVLQVLVLLLK